MENEKSLPEIPEIRQGIFDAAQNGELVLFVGAGVSKLLGCPSWEEFGAKILAHLHQSSAITYADLDALSEMEIHKQLSIAIDIASRKKIDLDFRKLLDPAQDNPAMKELYRALYSIGTVFVTTNYDEYLDDIPQKSGVTLEDPKQAPTAETAETRKAMIYYRKDDLTIAKLNEPGVVLHLHGSIKDPSTMVITTHDYIQHYQNPFIISFLQTLFATKVVVFIGYGLAEEEILEFALRKKGSQQTAAKEKKHFWVFPCLTRNTLALAHLKDYFAENFGVELLGFNIDRKGYDQLADVIFDWSKRLKGKVRRPVIYKELKETLEKIFS